MGTGAALSARGMGRKLTVSVLGLTLLAIGIFAVLNVSLIEQWGASLADMFKQGLPLPLTLLIVFLAGVLTSLTPCVYPVIPLAITYMGARNASSRMKAFSIAASYVTGMVACYTALGAFAAMTGTTFGASTQKWWIYGLVATIVLLFGLSMFGLFVITLPQALQRLAGRGRGAGYKGAFLMGATSGLVTAPCTAPVLGALILPMMARQSVALGSVLLAVFGLGMGMLFLVIGTYSGILTRLPRSGAWMGAVKVGLGVAILLVSAYFYYQAYMMFPLRAGGARGDGLPAQRVAHAAAAPSSEARSKAGEPTPSFEIVDLAGRRHQAGEYRGKTLHLVFFAVWCPPCVEQLRRVEVADARLRGRGYHVLVVGLKERQDAQVLRQFREGSSLAAAMAWDKDGSLAEKFRVASIPSHVIIGPEGRIVYEGRDLPPDFETDGAGLLPR